ncbi:MAG: SDR family oxidoreductase, partial [Planctomycetota bacterium]
SHGDAPLQLIDGITDVFSDLSILVNNASIFERAPLLETEPELFDRHFDINYRAPFFLTRDFARQCDQGLVINLVDTKISRNAGAYFAYTLTKKALLAFTKMAAAQLGPGIRVNAVAPGLVLPPAGEDERYLAERAKSIPLRRHGDPAAVCNAVAYLVNNRFITGQCIYVDGGEHLL